MGVLFTIKAKGAAGTAARVGTIAARFGAGPAAMLRRLDTYRDIAARHGAAPSLPITATVLARHARVIRPYVEQGIEFAIHGRVHNDHTMMSAQAQIVALQEARRIFARARVPAVGFRAPYLRGNESTLQSVRSCDLLYDSSAAYAFPLPRKLESLATHDGYRRALALYNARDANRLAVRPRLEHGLVSVPVALPDDEMLVDRAGLGAGDELTAAWITILDQTHARRDLFCVQLHPERIEQCSEALDSVLQEARTRPGGVWTARLDEIARWWLERDRCELSVHRTTDGWRVRLDGGPGVMLLVRPAGSTSEQVEPGRSVDFPGPRRPVVGLDPRVSSNIAEFLREEGYLVDRGSLPDHCGAYLSSDLDEMDIRLRLLRSPGPLVRAAPWPRGMRSAIAVTGDIDSITIGDFAHRLWETRPASLARWDRRGDALSEQLPPLASPHARSEPANFVTAPQASTSDEIRHGGRKIA